MNACSQPTLPRPLLFQFPEYPVTYPDGTDVVTGDDGNRLILRHCVPATRVVTCEDFAGFVQGRVDRGAASTAGASSDGTSSVGASSDGASSVGASSVGTDDRRAKAYQQASDAGSLYGNTGLGATPTTATPALWSTPAAPGTASVSTTHRAPAPARPAPLPTRVVGEPQTIFAIDGCRAMNPNHNRDSLDITTV